MKFLFRIVYYVNKCAVLKGKFDNSYDSIMSMKLFGFADYNFNCLQKNSIRIHSFRNAKFRLDRMFYN